MPHFIQIKINDVSIKAELNNSAAAQEIISAVITSMELPVLNALILNAAMISLYHFPASSFFFVQVVHKNGPCFLGNI